jgi:hypothetical protein
MVVYNWRAGDGPPQSGFTSPFSAFGNFPSIHMDPAENLVRTWVETSLYTITAMTDPMSTPFSPLWYADNGDFELALAYTEGSGIPTDPVLPDPTEGGGGEFLWRAQMKPFHDGTWTTPDGLAQVIRWEPQVDSQMQSKGQRAASGLDETWLTWVWQVQDIHGYFALEAANMFSYMTGWLNAHALVSTLS